MATRKQREHKRDVDEGKVFVPKRMPPMPSPKVVPLKHKKKLEAEREKETRDWDL
jgi:hypothetical protein